MKILTRRKVIPVEPVQEEVKEKKQRKSCKDNLLPPDEYRDEIDPVEIPLNEN